MPIVLEMEEVIALQDALARKLPVAELRCPVCCKVDWTGPLPTRIHAKQIVNAAGWICDYCGYLRLHAQKQLLNGHG